MCETIDWLGVFKSKLQFEPLTESSKQEYYYIIKQYLKYISGIGKDIQTITSQEIEMWLNPSTPRTFNKRRTVLRRFYALLGVSSDVEQIPHQSYRTFPKGGKQCTHENIFHMLEILKNQASLDFYALRTYCAVLLIYVYGLRECEIRKVCIEAINLTERTIVLRRRVYPISEDVFKALTDYLKMVPNCPKQGFLFFGRSISTPLAKQVFIRWIKKWAVLAGVPSLTIHTIVQLKLKETFQHLPEMNSLQNTVSFGM